TYKLAATAPIGFGMGQLLHTYQKRLIGLFAWGGGCLQNRGGSDRVASSLHFSGEKPLETSSQKPYRRRFCRELFPCLSVCQGPNPAKQLLNRSPKCAYSIICGAGGGVVFQCTYF